MAEKIKFHFIRRKFFYLLPMLSVAFIIGMYLSLVGFNTAYAVSGVTLSDPDSTGFGLDGRDFRINWTPAAETPAGFEYTKVYIVTSTMELTTSTLDSACTDNTGNACVPVGFFSEYNPGLGMEYYMPMMMTEDSNGQAWVTSTSYVAWVYTYSTVPTIVSSTAVSYASGYDIEADGDAPFFNHMGVHTATESVDANIYAIVNDEQTTATQFASTTDGGDEYLWVYYGTDVSSSYATSSAVSVSGNMFNFVVPSGSVPAAGNSFEYFLAANDANNNLRVFCAGVDPGTATVLTCDDQPFVVKTVAAGSRTIAGTITSGGSNLVGAKVYAGGFAGSAVTTDASGNYTITGLPNNNSYDITAYKVGYCDSVRFESVGSSNLTGINMSLNEGYCMFVEGNDAKPHVMFSGPPDGNQGVPVVDNIRIGMDQVMNGSTINDSNPTDAGSNIYLTPDDGSTKVAGQVTFCQSNNAPGCASIPTNDTNTILFNPTSDLTTSTFYTLVLTEGVLNGNGQSIEGNRPGGGYQISFTTAGSQINFGGEGAPTYGGGGQYMPPFVESIVPAPGSYVAPNMNILLEFNDTIDSTTVNATNFTLYNITDSTSVPVTSATLDSNEMRFVTMIASLTAEKEYEVRVKGAVRNTNGITISPPGSTNNNAFQSTFTATGSNDTTGPTVYPMVASASNISVNDIFEFGFSEQLDVGTINTSNITLKRGTTAVSASVSYNPGNNSVFVVPNDAMAPNTLYRVTFGVGVTDVIGNALAEEISYNYTTGNSDTISPSIKEVRCDDYTCAVFFTEGMNSNSQVGENWGTSVLNPTMWTLTKTNGGDVDISLTNAQFKYQGFDNMVMIEGFSGLVANDTFTLTASSTMIDLSSNVIDANGKTFSGVVESSSETYGGFNKKGMFGPPIAGGGSIGGDFKPEGFGDFTGEQFMFGQADMAFPFNQMAGDNSNVFQTRFTPGIALADNYQIVLTFPNGTDIGDVAPDTFSPFYNDFNEFGSGSVTFDTDFDTDGVGKNTTTREVSVQLEVDGTLDVDDPVTIDLRGIFNPLIPKGPESGGYTLGIKVKDASGKVVLNKTSMPYFINEGGTNTITIDVMAGSSTSSPQAGANGDVFMFGGGPAGPMDKNITLANGDISAVDGKAGNSISYASLPDGCYHFGTESSVTLNGSDYFGQMSPEPVCVNGGESKTKYILLSPAGGEGTASITVEIQGIDFAGANLDIFAGGPNNFVVKTLSSVGNTTVTPVTTTISFPSGSDGNWHVGVGPAMPKGSSAGKPTSLPGMPPPPADLKVSGTSVSAGFGIPPGVSFNNDTDTLTFTFASADKTISGTVTDGTNPLTGIEVFVHRQGFGMPMFDTTDSSGAFSISVSELGSYEIGAFKDGLPPSFKQIDVRVDGDDVGSDPDIYLNGKNVASVALTLKKPAYYISGKVLDSVTGGNGIGYAPVFAVNNTTGQFIGGGTDSSGNYTLFVDNGTWTVKGELPPSQTETCGTFSKTVIVASANMTSQNITPTGGSTCYTLSGTISVDGTGLANVPLFVEEWDSINNRPAVGGMGRGTGTDSDGIYSVKVGGSKTYRVGTWHPDYGEVGEIVSVATANKTQNIAITAAVATFSFTGGTSEMEGFVELKHSSFSDNKKRVGKAISDLSTSHTVNVESGQTYDYFVDVFGVGKFSGTVVAGATATVDLGVTAGGFITVTGTIKDGSDNVLPGALVVFTNTSTAMVKTALTDSSGNYTVSLKADTYEVGASLAGYVAGGAASEVTFTASTTGHSFGAGEEHASLAVADRNIEGTINDSSGSPMSEGYVWAENSSTGVMVKAPVDADDGSYSLPVTAGEWSVSAAGPLHEATVLDSAVDTSSSGQTGKNISLTADVTRAPESASGIIAASTGGTIDDTDGSGIKITSGSGVLEAGSGNVTLSVERNYTAPDSESFQPLANAVFDIEASGNSTIKSLKGNAEIQLDYGDLIADLPDGVSEADLQLMYYSPERGDYVPVEGGFTVDPDNNTITGLVDHFTSFVVTFASPAVVVVAPAAPAAPAAPSSAGVGSVGTNAPTSASALINANETETDNREVVLTLNAVNATQMAIANSSDFNNSSFDAYNSTTTWTLSEGNGTKRVYVKFRSSDGGTNTVSDSIILTGQETDQSAEEETSALQEDVIVVKEPVVCDLTMGSAYKHTSSPAVYYITDECTKRAFKRSDVFFTYFDSWSDVELVDKVGLDAITDDTLGFMPWGPKYDPKYGALVKIVTDPKVYLLLNTERYWITSETVFTTLNYAWNWIEDVATDLLDKYTVGSEITDTDHHPNYTLIKYENDPKVYRLEPNPEDLNSQVKRWVPDENVFNSLNFRWDRIVTVDEAEVYDTGINLLEA